MGRVTSVPTILLAQVEVEADKRENLKKFGRAFAAARTSGAQLVVFPEVALAYLPSTASNAERWEAAESMEGPAVREMRELAAHHGVWAVFGMYERPGEKDPLLRVYSSVAVVAPSGEVAGVYRKSHLYDAFGHKESDEYVPGNEIFNPIETPFGRLGVLVCYELRFPEVARTQALRGADLLAIPSAWYAGPLKEMHFELLVRARALENGIYAAACDQAGNGFVGRSLVSDPLGVPIAVASEQPDQFVLASLERSRVESTRRTFPYRDQRRPDLYRS